jgi:hypothetical protein
MAVTVDLGAKANLQAGTDGSYTPKPIGEVTSVSVSLAADPIDITPIAQAAGAVFQYMIAGKRSATLTFNLNHDGVNDAYHKYLIDDCILGRSNAFRLGYPQNTAKYIGFSGIVSSFDISDDPDNKHSADLTINSTGTITIADA